MVLQHVDKPLLPIIVMEQRRVEAGGVYVPRIRPGTLDLVRTYDIVRSIFERAVFTLDVCVDQPELLAIVG